MRRLRLVFALLAAVLLVPLFLLVQRAFESTSVERSVRHAAVAERAFDEMERELSRALLREEERPFEDYPVDVADAKSWDPRAPSNPWIVGYFQIEPDGRFRGPATPDADGEDLEVAVRRGLRLAAVPAVEPASAPEPARLRSQAPGTTRRLEQKKSKGAGAPFELDALEAADAEVAQESERADAYKVLSSLNRAADERAERPKTSARPRTSARLKKSARPETSPSPSSIASMATEPTAQLFGRTAVPPAAAVARRENAAPELRDLAVGFAADDGLAEAGRLGAVEGIAAASAERFVEEERASVELEPMVGRVVDGQRLLLARTVLVGEQGYRQGLVVDVPALTGWLDRAVLGRSELAASAGRSFFLEGETPPPPDPGRYVFVHRFAEPFDSLGLQLALAPLPEARGTAYLYAIAVLLLVSGAGGLFALYRMVVVRVRFAERRSNFVAAVTHELRTPLTAIRMYGEMLRDGMVDSDEKRDEYYATITAESERLTRLINNVLEFSRLEQGTRDMSWVVGSIGPVIEEAARLLGPHARETGFEIRVEVDPGLPAVRYDRDAVLQVVFNLVDNALKYARDAGNRVIDIRATRHGEGVELSVRDRGPGVPARHRSRVFEPFYRAEDELTRRAKGTGIGLALVKGLAERMGAAVTGREPADGGFEVALTFRAAPAG